MCRAPAEAYGLDLKDVDVPVIGGHAGTTILPLLSQVNTAVRYRLIVAFALCCEVHQCCPCCKAPFNILTSRSSSFIRSAPLFHATMLTTWVPVDVCRRRRR